MTKPVKDLRTKQVSQPAETDDLNIILQTNYKNFSWFTNESNRRQSKHISHECPFRCPTCEVIGKDLIKLQYTNCNNVLLEDDSKLIFVPMF